MPLNPQYVIAPSLQVVFRDKDTGLPLRNGVIYFWKDQARSEPKPIFKLSGSPPNYGYTQLPNPLTLSAIGTMDDPNTNQDIIPYYFPYDADGNVELYFIEVYSEGGKTSGTLQFTREGWPNISESVGPEEQAFENYIPNGQFRIHYDLPKTDTLDAGEVRAPITVLGPGGWTFERPSGSSAKDTITFDRLPDTFQTPRFAIKIESDGAGIGDSNKDLCIKFTDVNMFSSDENQQYTFAFSGRSNSVGGNVPVELFLLKNFGTPNGDSPSSRSLGTFNLVGSYPSTPLQVSFSFGSNESKTIGTNNDDYLQLALRFPVSSQFDASLTDFSLAFGEVTVAGYPVQTDADTLTRSIAGWMPIPKADGSNLYLNLQLTAEGIQYDSSAIGMVEQDSGITNYTNSLHPSTNLMLADGTQYETSGYSPLGIPYSRLQTKYFDTTANAPIWGTGREYFTAALFNSGVEFRIVNNTYGVVTATANGTTSTGFTFKTIFTGVNLGPGLLAPFNIRAFYIDSNLFVFEGLTAGAVDQATPNTSGFSITNFDPGTVESTQRVQVETVAASALANPGGPAKFWEFTSDKFYYVWYKITNETDPALTNPSLSGKTGIQINPQPDYDAPMVAQVTRESLNGWNITSVRTIAAATIPPGSFFTASSTNGTTEIDYYVWNTIDGVGTDPAVANATGIQVDLLSTDTLQQVSTKNQIAINSKYFASPDLRGASIRGLNVGTGTNPWITDWGPRISTVPGFQNGDYGTMELDAYRSHSHVSSWPFEGMVGTSTGSGSFATSPSPSGPENQEVNVTDSGQSESRGVNVALTYVVRY